MGGHALGFGFTAAIVLQESHPSMAVDRISRKPSYMRCT